MSVQQVVQAPPLALLLAAPQQSLHEARDAARPSLHPPLERWELHVVECQVKEQRLARDGPAVRGERGQQGSLAGGRDEEHIRTLAERLEGGEEQKMPASQHTLCIYIAHVAHCYKIQQFIGYNITPNS